MVDIKESVEAVMHKIKHDPDFKGEFKDDPIKAIENASGIDLPDEQVEHVIHAVKEKSEDIFEDVMDNVKGLFKK